MTTPASKAVAAGAAMAAAPVPPPPPPRREGANSAKHHPSAHHVSPPPPPPPPATPAANDNPTAPGANAEPGRPPRTVRGGLRSSIHSSGSRSQENIQAIAAEVSLLLTQTETEVKDAPLPPRKICLERSERSEPSLLSEPSLVPNSHGPDTSIKKGNFHPTTGRVTNKNSTALDEAEVLMMSPVTTQSKALTENEAAEFKRFCSMSLNELDRDLDSCARSLDGSDGRRGRRGEQFTSSFSGREQGEFKPRPVRVSQFEDGMDGAANVNANEPSTPRGRSKQVVTTTTFVNSIKRLPSLDRGAMAAGNTVATGGSHGGGPTANLAEAPYKPRPSSPKPVRAPAGHAAGHPHPASLPDNVDKKGRCLRHPNVKLFKKKLLGGYEVLRPQCPNCVEEAPYEEMWRGRAKHRRGDSRERGGPRRLASRERGGSFDSFTQSKQRLRSRSRGRRSRSRERPEMPGEPGEKPLPCVPPLRGEAEDEAVSRGPVGRKSPCVFPPPPPLSHQGSRPSPPPRRRRSSPFDPRGRVRSLSAGRAPQRDKALDDTPQAEKQQPLNTGQNKSIFDKGMGKLSSGMDKLSSLQGQARSSSRNKRGSDDWMASCNSLGASASDVDCRRSPRHSKRVVHAPEKGQKTPPAATKKKTALGKFDKATGRCKKHPSVVMARKSRFNRGWDIIRDTCPYCSEGKGTLTEDGGNDFSEISKKKMNALLQGRTADADGPHCQSFLSDDPIAGGAITRSTNRNPRGRMAHESNVVDAVPPPPSGGGGGPARVSRMPYTTPWGESGWYTGEVDKSGQPHGQGRMRYKTGNQYEGEWINGYSEQFVENRDRMRAGFGTNIAKWKESDRQAEVARLCAERAGAGQTAAAAPSSNEPPPGHQSRYPAAPPQAAYPYGMVQYSPQVVQPQVMAMMPAAMYGQSPGYQCTAQSPGGAHGNLPNPSAYNPGYH